MAWTDGGRVPDRTDFLEALAMLTPRDKKQIVIVQPHVSKAIRDQIMVRDAAQGYEPSPEKFRLSTLETLLHTTPAAAVAVGADLYAIGSNQ